MRKIKIVVSDFHIAKGAYLSDGRRNILEDFTEDDVFIEFLEYYCSEEFAEAEVELVLNGDFFNMLQVDYQDEFVEMITEEISMHKMEKIRNGHMELFDALKKFEGLPNRSIVFIVGNHDAAMLWPDVKKQLKTWISPRIRIEEDAYTFDHVMITHGHRHEFIHHFNPKQFWYEAASGERYMRLPWGSYFVIDFLNRMKLDRPFIDKVKPFRRYLRFAFFNDFFFFWKIIFSIFKFWFKNRIHSDPYRRREFKLSPKRLYDAMSHMGLTESAERILKKTNYRIVIMGHTHNYDFRQFGTHGEYFNTGTWNETISLEVYSLGRSLNRTYVYLEYDEKGQPRAALKRWVGKHKAVQDLRL